MSQYNKIVTRNELNVYAVLDSADRWIGKSMLKVNNSKNPEVSRLLQNADNATKQLIKKYESENKTKLSNLVRKDANDISVSADELSQLNDISVILENITENKNHTVSSNARYDYDDNLRGVKDLIHKCIKANGGNVISRR
jgi:hypothetical protein